MSSFTRLDKALTASVNDLHDHLWTKAAKDEAALLRRLETYSADLDRHLGTRGAIARSVRPLTRPFKKYPGGKDLFEFLHTIGHLAAAVELRPRRPRDAAKRAAEVVTSHAIGLAAAADSFHLVEAFEAGKSTFLEFTAALADVLEEKGVVFAGEFKRTSNAAYDVNAVWDEDWPKEFGLVASAQVIVAAGFATALYVEALRALGQYHEIPHARLVPVVRRIVDRIGAHA
ncbi:MAG: hypothetical protein A3K68_01410 [Euryarchaeota archaeon RBG_16_68_13]|nr:MAG: hypothetical protein A3K68_01410 [Euryarchaeota archaeon RBG_16_68_13]